MIRAALFVIACVALASPAHAVVNIRFPDFACPAGWQVTPVPANKDAFSVQCPGGAPVPTPTPTPTPTPQPNQGISCPGFNRTIVVDLDWTHPGRVIPNQTMGANDVIVARFTTGSVDSPDNNLPTISGAEWGDGPPSGRYAVLSDKPCDFAAQEWPGAASAGNSVQVPFSIGAGSNWFYYPRTKKATTYYFNVRNLNQQQSCMAQGYCGMFIELSHNSGV